MTDDGEPGRSSGDRIFENLVPASFKCYLALVAQDTLLRTSLCFADSAENVHDEGLRDLFTSLCELLGYLLDRRGDPRLYNHFPQRTVFGRLFPNETDHVKARISVLSDGSACEPFEDVHAESWVVQKVTENVELGQGEHAEFSEK